MLVVGERLNTSRQPVRTAVRDRNEAFLLEEARKQVDRGAHYLDVNVGTFVSEEAELLPWLVETIQKEVPVPLCIDTSSAAALRAGLRAHQGRAMVNSLHLDESVLQDLLPLIGEYQASVVCLCMTGSGPTADSTERLKIAEQLARRLLAEGISPEQVYFDPIIQPVATEPLGPTTALHTLLGIKRELPEFKTVAGLSNVSFGLPGRSVVNRTFLTMALAAGLDAAIVDPVDRDLMSALLVSETVLGKDPFCRRYLKAYRENQQGRSGGWRKPSK